jgi:hypothetical protein
MYDHSEEGEDSDLGGNENEENDQNLKVLHDSAGLLPNPTKKQAGDTGRTENKERNLKNNDYFGRVDVANTGNELVDRYDDGHGEQ